MGGLFITGTDTGVGKTVVTSQLGRVLQHLGYDVGVIKPVQTGIESDFGDYAVYKKWMKVDGEEYVVPYKFKAPQAPSIAASLERREIRFDDLLSTLYILMKRHRNMLIEGAGGVLVPISKKKSMRDLMVEIGFPVLVVARAELGTINHTLLTVESLKSVGLKVTGVVFNQVGNPDNAVLKMVQAEIAKLSGVKHF
ncbi:MAG: dethiobiotin synthase, partial [Fibrobacteres bacterium]|nr:dethiobiotin synthase [Fibrobacterota bacterium]